MNNESFVFRVAIHTFIALAGLSMMSSCSNIGFQKGKGGILYKIYSGGGSRRVKIGDIVQLNFSVRTEGDSMVYSTWNTGYPLHCSVTHSETPTDLMDILVLLAEKDSVIIRNPSDSIFEKRKGISRPPFFKPKRYAIYTLKVEKVMNQQDYQTQKLEVPKKEIDSMNKKREAELPMLRKYIADNYLHVDSTKEGTFYVVKTAGKGPAPLPGDTVYVTYVGKLINGDVFDTNDSALAMNEGISRPASKLQGGNKPISFIVGAHQVIEGWDDYFKTAKKGSKATLIIPSRLAYGEVESGPQVPAFSTLIYDIELVDLKTRKSRQKMPTKPLKAFPKDKTPSDTL